MENANRLRDAMTQKQTHVGVLIHTLEKLQVLDHKLKQDMEDEQDMDTVRALERIMARDQAKILDLKQGLEQAELFHRLPRWFLGPVLTLIPGKSLDLKHALEKVSAQVRVEALELRQAVDDMWAHAQAQNLSSGDIQERREIVGYMEGQMEGSERSLGQILDSL